MALCVYVDGSGGDGAGFGFFVKETADSAYKKCAGLTNMEAEYEAIGAALEWLDEAGHNHEDITIYCDSQTTVEQLNHKYGINSDSLRERAMRIWKIMKSFTSLNIVWISRKANLAGKMLGS